MKTPINYLGRMIRDAILMVAGIMIDLIVSLSRVEKGTDPLKWIAFAIGLIFMAGGIWEILESWRALQQ